MNDDLCCRDTPFFVGGIRAAAASVRRSHVARLPRSPNPYAHLPHHPFCVVFLLTPVAAAKLRNPRDCYAGGLAGGRSTGCSSGYYYCCYTIILSAADDTRKPRAQLCIILYATPFTRVIIYLCYAHISICVHFR